MPNDQNFRLTPVDRVVGEVEFLARLEQALRIVFPTTDGAGWEQFRHSDKWFQTTAEKIKREMENYND